MSLLNFVQIRKDAILPSKSSYPPHYSGDSGYDLYANFNNWEIDSGISWHKEFTPENLLSSKSHIIIPPGTQIKVPTGLSPRIQNVLWQTYVPSSQHGDTVYPDYQDNLVKIPFYLELEVRPKSGRAYKEKLSITNTPGTIDNSYTGEIQVLLHNLGHEDIFVYHQHKIAQIIPQFVPELGEPKWVEEDYEPKIEYNRQGGFGSTGLGL